MVTLRADVTASFVEEVPLEEDVAHRPPGRPFHRTNRAALALDGKATLLVAHQRSFEERPIAEPFSHPPFERLRAGGRQQNGERRSPSGRPEHGA